MPEKVTVAAEGQPPSSGLVAAEGQPAPSIGGSASAGTSNPISSTAPVSTDMNPTVPPLPNVPASLPTSESAGDMESLNNAQLMDALNPAFDEDAAANPSSSALNPQSNLASSSGPKPNPTSKKNKKKKPSSDNRCMVRGCERPPTGVPKKECAREGCPKLVHDSCYEVMMTKSTKITHYIS